MGFARLRLIKVHAEGTNSVPGLEIVSDTRNRIRI